MTDLNLDFNFQETSSKCTILTFPHNQIPINTFQLVVPTRFFKNKSLCNFFAFLVTQATTKTYNRCNHNQITKQNLWIKNILSKFSTTTRLSLFVLFYKPVRFQISNRAKMKYLILALTVFCLTTSASTIDHCSTTATASTLQATCTTLIFTTAKNTAEAAQCGGNTCTTPVSISSAGVCTEGTDGTTASTACTLFNAEVATQTALGFTFSNSACACTGTTTTATTTAGAAELACSALVGLTFLNFL